MSLGKFFLQVLSDTVLFEYIPLDIVRPLTFEPDEEALETAAKGGMMDLYVKSPIVYR